jgi:hypothetical protein
VSRSISPNPSLILIKIISTHFKNNIKKSLKRITPKINHITLITDHIIQRTNHTIRRKSHIERNVKLRLKSIRFHKSMTSKQRKYFETIVYRGKISTINHSAKSTTVLTIEPLNL